MEIFHEPFGDCYYHGKEMMGERYMEDTENQRTSANPEFDDITYKSVFESILNGTAEVRIFLYQFPTFYRSRIISVLCVSSAEPFRFTSY